MIQISDFLKLCIGMRFQGNPDAYSFDYAFTIPRIVCNDGFTISIQISHTNYCESENGYRQFGLTWLSAEFGFPSQHEELLSPYSEDPRFTEDSVGRVPVEVLQQVIDKHQGIDFARTTTNIDYFFK